MASIYKDFYFCLSCDLALDLKVYIDRLDISGLPTLLKDQAEEFIVSVRVIDGGAPVTSGIRATHTPYRDGESVYFNEWVVLPVEIKDLSKTCQLVGDSGQSVTRSLLSPAGARSVVGQPRRNTVAPSPLASLLAPLCR